MSRGSARRPARALRQLASAVGLSDLEGAGPGRAGIHIGVLGPLVVHHNDREVPIPSPMQRSRPARRGDGIDADDCHHDLVTTRERIRMSAWGMIALQIILGSFHAYGGLMELKFRLDAVRTEARIGDAGLGPEWTLEIQWNGELHTARTSRLAGSPQEGDRIIVMIDPSDPTIAVSPGMPMQDWSELPWLLIMHTSFVVGAILVLRLVRPEGQEAPARPILQPGGFPVRPRRSGGTRPARRRRTRP